MNKSNHLISFHLKKLFIVVCKLSLIGKIALKLFLQQIYLMNWISKKFTGNYFKKKLIVSLVDLVLLNIKSQFKHYVLSKVFKSNLEVK